MVRTASSSEHDRHDAEPITYMSASAKVPAGEVDEIGYGPGC
jgi:hypothetical protein